MNLPIMFKMLLSESEKKNHTLTIQWHTQKRKITRISLNEHKQKEMNEQYTMCRMVCAWSYNKFYMHTVWAQLAIFRICNNWRCNTFERVEKLSKAYSK